MSYVNTISHFKNPIGKGVDREAFYSRKYDLVFKHTFRKHDTREQSKGELDLYNKMTEAEREFFPIQGSVTYKGDLYIIMGYVKPGNKIHATNDWVFSYYLSSSIAELDEICEHYGLDNSYNEGLANFIAKFHIRDLHDENFGAYHNHLAIIDAGL